jgi:hypothetical protein
MLVDIQMSGLSPNLPYHTDFMLNKFKLLHQTYGDVIKQQKSNVAKNSLVVLTKMLWITVHTACIFVIVTKNDQFLIIGTNPIANLNLFALRQFQLVNHFGAWLM